MIVCPRCQREKPDGVGLCDRCQSQIAEFEAELNQILEQIEEGRFSGALERIGQVMEIAPTEFLAQCYALRGFAHLKKLAFARSEEDLTESISLDWEKPQAYAWRAAARGEQNKWQLAFDDLDQAYHLGGSQQDHYLELMDSMLENARDYFRDLIRRRPDDADLFFERGWVYLRTGKYAKAYRDLQRALELQPKHPWAAVAMAELILIKEELKETYDPIHLCKLGLKGPPECRQRAIENAAQYHLKMGEFAKAKVNLRKLATLVADHPKDLVQCAQFLRQLHDQLAAIDLLNRVLQRNQQHPLALLTRGDCYADIRNYALAIQDFSLYLDRFPNSTRGLVRRGKVFLAVNNIPKAIQDLKKVVKVDPTNVEANLKLSQAYSELGSHDLALSQCQKAVDLDNSRADSYACLASIYSKLCDDTSAVDEYSRSIELAQSSADQAQYRFLRGIAYYKQEAFDKALADFESATSTRPNHAGSWIWKGATHARNEEWGEAILSLQQAIQVNPVLSEQYQKIGKPIAEKGIRHYRRLEQRGHHYAAVYFYRAIAHQFLGQYEESIQDLTAANRLKPRDHEILLRRGQAYGQINQLEHALADFDLVLMQNPKLHQAYYRRARVLADHGQFEKAKQDIQKAIQISPKTPNYHYYNGNLNLQLGCLKQAIEAFDLAILQDASHYAAYQQRGETHLQLQEYLSAIRDFSHAHELNPQEATFLVRRGQAHLKSKYYVTALEDFELALSINDRVAAAYAGRAEILVIQQRFEYALIWLTKAIHRFSQPADLAEIVLARGKVFLSMGRPSPALNDFNYVLETMRNSDSWTAQARFYRAIAKVHLENFDSAKRDFEKVLAIDSGHSLASEGVEWLQNRKLPLPAFLYPPVSQHRPTRPNVARTGVTLSHQYVEQIKSERPHDLWLVRSPNKSEFGPISLELLTLWASEGRLINGMKLLRADWSKWKRIERVFPEITPLESLPGLVEDFPELDLKSVSKRPTSENR